MLKAYEAPLNQGKLLQLGVDTWAVGVQMWGPRASEVIKLWLGGVRGSLLYHEGSGAQFY